MPYIKLLSENLINQIAAGEVVERPASVVKELVENALDAGAKRLIIEVGDGGDLFIRVTDDGIGMDREDAVLAFERHATSKISDADDLFNIHTLGFRGEAIASIASVAQVKLQTKKRGDIEGTIVLYEGGVRKGVKAAGVPEGTHIEVKNLFYNTPARKKYLKTAGTEFGHIVDVICGIALAFPEVAFKLYRNNKVVLDLATCEDPLLRIRAVLGKETADNVVPVFYGHHAIKLEGYIGKPVIARASRKDQYLFVNRRLVKSNSISYAVRQSYYSLLPKEKQPVFLLYLQIDPMLVDVNVHPRKLEIRFNDEKELFSIVSQACKKALEKHVLAPKFHGDSEAAMMTYHRGRPHQQPYTLEDSGQLKNHMQPGSPNSQNQYSVQQAMAFSQMISKQGTVEEKENSSGAFQTSEQAHVEGVLDAGLTTIHKTMGIQTTASHNLPIASESHSAIERTCEGKLVPLAQLNNSYILCHLQTEQHENGLKQNFGLQKEGLVIVDQHAAHERIRYTELVSNFETEKKISQSLLVPLQLEFSFQEVALIEENLKFLQQLGFEIEPFGGKTFSVFAIPVYLVKHDIAVTLRGLLDDFTDGVGKGDFQKRKERALTYMACRSAVKFGDPLSQQEQVALVKKLQTIPLAYTCPHGRPTMVTISFEELEKRFGRR